MLVIIIGLLAITANVVKGQTVNNNDVISIKEAPYQVSVQCAGTNLFVGNIISKRVVLTANYGFYSLRVATDYSIRYGSSSFGEYGSISFGGDKNVISVQNILRYTNTILFKNDIALLRLVSDIPFSAVAKPIPLASIAPPIGTNIHVTGWGFSDDIGTLRQDSVEIADISVCRGYFPRTIPINKNSLCAAVKRNGDRVCAYTAGSSLVSNGELIGTSAIGRGCATDYYHGTFSNIAVYKSWIDSHVNAELENV